MTARQMDLIARLCLEETIFATFICDSDLWLGNMGDFGLLLLGVDPVCFL